MTAHPLLYFLAFILALGILIVFHEAGHFLVARWCGVKVLRFSVGFGKTLFIRRWGKDQTEWAVSLIPLGGFVRMLDEQEGPVAPQELHRAFNRQPVWRRFLIVAAGPVANLLLAVLLYWVLFLQGSEELRPIVHLPAAGTPAAQAGLPEGATIRSVNGHAVRSWQEMRWEFTQVALDREPVVLEAVTPGNALEIYRIETVSLGEDDLDKDVLGKLGLKVFQPLIKPFVGEVTADSPASRADLRADDEILSIDGLAIKSWREVVAKVKASADKPLMIELRRAGQVLQKEATPAAAMENGQRVGRLGMMVRDDPALHEQIFVRIERGPLESLGKSVMQTGQTASFTLKMMGRMLVGELSWKNLSGPVTIADYAGRSAQMGWMSYLSFIALISISLGVLNLLPIPILDGGHLLYYIVELAKGGPLPERVMEFGQKIGLALLLMMMAFALFNDIHRLLSS